MYTDTYVDASVDELFRYVYVSVDCVCMRKQVR